MYILSSSCFKNELDPYCLILTQSRVNYIVFWVGSVKHYFFHILADVALNLALCPCILFRHQDNDSHETSQEQSVATTEITDQWADEWVFQP